jgi:restriction endonuclease S subunit
MARLVIMDISKVKENKDFRIEPEFYALNFERKSEYLVGSDIIDFIQYGTSKALNEEKKGFPILRLNEFDGIFTAYPEKYCNILSKSEFDKLKFKTNDVLICRTNGNPNLVGKAAVIMEDADVAFASYLFRIRPNQKINSSTLAVYLNSKMGREQIQRHSAVSNQTNFSPAKFKSISIPNFSTEIQIEVNSLIYSAYSMNKEAHNLYDQASRIIKEEIGEMKVNSKNNCIEEWKRVRTNERIDAEYYAPLFQESTKILNSYPNGTTMLKDNNILDGKFVPEPDRIYSYIELGNIDNKLGMIRDFSLSEGRRLPSRARRIVREGNVIVSSVEGSLEASGLISEGEDGFVCSTGFHVLDFSEQFLPETLLMIMKSSLIQNLLKRGSTGTILSAISKNELKKIPLPLIPIETQRKIGTIVKKSHKLRREVRELVNRATKIIENS